MAEAPLDVPQEKSTPMTDEERVALCKKLDEELEDFIDSMKKTPYTDGWSEDNWEVKFFACYFLNRFQIIKIFKI